eukprot:SAG11_NODE_382_length_9923_cov_29.276771_9_plen_238_part_00
MPRCPQKAPPERFCGSELLVAIRVHPRGASDAATVAGTVAVTWDGHTPSPPPLTLELRLTRERKLDFEVYDVTGHRLAQHADVLRTEAAIAHTQAPLHLCDLAVAEAAGAAVPLLGKGSMPNGYELQAVLADGWPAGFAPTSRIIMRVLKCQAEAGVETEPQAEDGVVGGVELLSSGRALYDQVLFSSDQTHMIMLSTIVDRFGTNAKIEIFVLQTAGHTKSRGNAKVSRCRVWPGL